MKIILIAMPSVHFTRWIENLNGAGFELYWFDILDRGNFKVDSNIQQIVNWKKVKIKFKGKGQLKKLIPSIYAKISFIFETTVTMVLQKLIKDIKPDIVHSFEMHHCSFPVLQVMKKFSGIKWIYSCWGSDLYFFQQYPAHNKVIRQVLSRGNFLITDCLRDYKIATDLGFAGTFLGVIPGGGGYKLHDYERNIQPFESKNLILIKGYEHDFGRALNVVKAIRGLEFRPGIEIVIFGAHKQVVDYVVNYKLDIKLYERHELTNTEVLSMMGRALIYIGNSISDGMPNTLLEAIIMNAFPIQSNPGGASAELIHDKVNGLLINDPENVEEIRQKIVYAINHESLLKNAIVMNKEIALQKLEYNTINRKILNVYNDAYAN